MPRSSALRAVPASTGRPAEQQLSVRDAAESGSRRDLLVSLRDRIAAEVDAGVPPRDLASLSKRLMDIVLEIEAVDAAESGDDVGDAASTPDEPWTG